MKKIIFSVVTILVANFSFGQITLEHSFSNEDLQVYVNSEETFYYSASNNGTTISIYKSDYSIYKQFIIEIPASYEKVLIAPSPFMFSRNIFNTDDKFEIVVVFSRSNTTTYQTESLFRIYNEDGMIIKDFGPNYSFHGDASDNEFYVYHDNTSNKNKLRLLNQQTNSTEIFVLPTTSLGIKEIERQKNFVAFPIPTNKILNIVNPKNGVNRVEIFDASGKLVLNKSFTNSENKISLDVENLPKGIFIYKIGELSSKFIKN